MIVALDRESEGLGPDELAERLGEAVATLLAIVHAKARRGDA